MKTYLIITLSLCINLCLAQQKGYYRTPSIYKDKIVFTAEGDLWKFDISNSVTSRLTTNLGVESYPVISPDGKQIAFAGQIEGATEIYLMEMYGSVPKRLTYDYDAKPVGWTNDGMILYTTSRYNSLPDKQLIKLNPVTLSSEILPLSQASDGCFDGNTLIFTRLPKQGSNNKRYKGGTIQQLWKFDGVNEASCLTCDFDGTSTNPMIYKERIYFLSDRDGSMNIWSSDKDGKSLRQHTFSKEWDIKSPSIYESSIVYQKGADLWLFDIEKGTEKILDITLNSDFDQRKPKWFKNPNESITFTSISPDGNFIGIISRGRLFTAPSLGGRWIEINRKSGLRFKEVQFLDEKNIAYISDESGEFEIWKTLADGTGKAIQLTKDSKVLISLIQPSPDGKYIAYSDADGFLKVIESGSGALKLKNPIKDYDISDISWSSNSQYISFSHTLENLVTQINVIDLKSGKNNSITTNRLDSYVAKWTKKDDWLYFLSDRNIKTKVQSPWGSRQPEPYYVGISNIYGLQLNDTVRFPFIQPDPWIVVIKSDKSFQKNGKKDKSKTKENPVNEFDWVQISKDLFQVPVKSDNIKDLLVADGFLYWVSEDAEGKRKLFAIKMNSKKIDPVEIADDIARAQLSSNKNKLLIIKKNNISVADANGEKIDLEKSKIDLNSWSFMVDPVEDWKQMFNDAWRMMRDYFYDKNMHGVDWGAIKTQHAKLLDRLTDRYELDDLLAQMVSELSALHVFVFGGDKRKPSDETQTGFLGAKLIKCPQGFKISHIYLNDPDYPDGLSPLAKPDLKIKEGDVITKINDIPLISVSHFSELLADKSGVSIKLSLIDDKLNEYDQIVKPISANEEATLRYREWELTRRQQVDKESNETIGYIHLMAMSGSDMDDFVKQYYPVFTRKGLILDVRHNRGGNIDSWILEKLMRKAWFYWQQRDGQSYSNMQYAFRGHMVLLCDQFTASDGEAISEGFRRLGLGKVIGMRTWGGEIWLSYNNRLVDNGVASAPASGVFGLDGKWLIEGHGVDPDFVVDNLPHEAFLGKDAQLQYAIDYLKKKIEQEPVNIPVHPAYPDKSFKYN